MKYLLLSLTCLFLFNSGKSQVICDSTGNLFIYANYDGGVLNIDVDMNMPNIKIGICTYEPVTINLSGAFLNNVTEVRYAGYVSTTNSHCSNSPSTTTIIGAPVTASTSVTFLPTATLSNSNGNASIVCAYSCSTGTSQGGCNTPDQIIHYFESTMSADVITYFTQYGCWLTSAYKLSSGGNCCSANCTTTATAGSDSTICLGESLLLNASSTGGTTYSWSPTIGLSNPAIANPTANPIVNTTYVLTVTDGGSCSAMDSMVVTVNPTPATPIISQIGADTLSSSPSGDSCHWYFEGVLLSMKTQTIVPSQNGNYTVICWQNGCPSDTSANILFELTSLEYINWAKGIKVFPNPTQDLIWIEGNANVFTASVYSLHGKLIVPEQTFEKNALLNLKTLRKGLYVIKINSTKGQSFVKIILQ